MKRRLLLLQVRDQRAAERQEKACFLDRLGVESSELATINLVSEPQIEWSDVAEADAVFIGGAGAHSVTGRHEFTEPLAAVVRQLAEERRPLFGSCLGHQFLAEALGGSVITDPDSEEVGTFDVDLTAAGREDPLFGELPSRFAVQLGHKDRVDRMPEGAICLASSNRCGIQALRIADKPIYGTQFHSEMTVEHIRERLQMYGDSYLGEDPETVEASLRASVDADRLLRRFVELFT